MKPGDETLRLAALRELRILDTAAEERFDRLTRLTANVMDVPIAAISLMDADRQWFKSKVGLDVTQTARSVSFCRFAIEDNATLVVTDAAHDERFADNPLVTGAPGIRFYAGIPLRTADGLPLGTLCAIDCKPRKLEESQLQALQDLAALVEPELRRTDLLQLTRIREEENRRLQEILDNIPIAVSQKDTEGRLTRVNRAWVRLTGNAASSAIGKRASEFLPMEDASLLEAEELRFMKGSVNFMESEFHLRSHRGEVTASVYRARTFDANGECDGMLAAIIDISRRKAAERALEEAKLAAERSSAAKDVFLSTMSHEIRTPLSGMLGMLELLSLSQLDREQRETLEIARDSGRAMGRIIDDILDHAKIEAGKLEIVPEPVSIAQLLPRVANTYVALASAKDLTLSHFVDPRIAPALLVDPLRLMQVLGNLTSNAIKFTREGCIDVRVELLELKSGAQTLCFTVKDTGLGMNEEQKLRLFRPFEQAAIDTTRLYGGTGLGLSICRRLVEMMGGGIEVQSALGMGTTMRVLLTLETTMGLPVDRGGEGVSEVKPLVGPHAGDSGNEWDKAEQGDSEGDGPWVLAVDDNPTNRMMLARQLRLLGLRTSTASEGAEALALWRSGKFNLVVSDCNMPGMDGYDLARNIREEEGARRLPRIPILGWTANAQRENIDRCLSVGMDDVLSKPSDIGNLRAMLKRWLSAESDAAPVEAAPVEEFDSPRVAQAPAQDRIIDLSIIREASRGDEAKAKVLAGKFRERLLFQVAEIKTLIEAGDVRGVQQSSHRIVGTAGYLGAGTLVALCKNLETAARDGEVATFASAGDAISSASDRALAALDREFEEKPLTPA